jgi:hypothetical protein
MGGPFPGEQSRIYVGLGYTQDASSSRGILSAWEKSGEALDRTYEDETVSRDRQGSKKGKREKTSRSDFVSDHL